MIGKRPTPVHLSMELLLTRHIFVLIVTSFFGKKPSFRVFGGLCYFIIAHYSAL